MRKDRIYKVKFSTDEGVENAWIDDQANVLEEDGESAIAKVKKDVAERKAKFRLEGLELIATADLC